MVKRGEREFLVPCRSVFENADLAARRIEFELPEGLLECSLR